MLLRIYFDLDHCCLDKYAFMKFDSQLSFLFIINAQAQQLSNQT